MKSDIAVRFGELLDKVALLPSTFDHHHHATQLSRTVTNVPGGQEGGGHGVVSESCQCRQQQHRHALPLIYNCPPVLFPTAVAWHGYGYHLLTRYMNDQSLQAPHPKFEQSIGLISHPPCTGVLPRAAARPSAAEPSASRDQLQVLAWSARRFSLHSPHHTSHVTRHTSHVPTPPLTLSPPQGIGACHFAEGRLEEAIVHFATVAELEPSEASLFNLANAQGKAEHSVAAAATYRRVLKINPNRHDAAAKLVHFTHYVCDWSRRKADVRCPYPCFYNRISVQFLFSGRRAARHNSRSNRARSSNIRRAIQRHHPAVYSGGDIGGGAAALVEDVQGCAARAS